MSKAKKCDITGEFYEEEKRKYNIFLNGKEYDINPSLYNKAEKYANKLMNVLNIEQKDMVLVFGANGIKDTMTMDIVNKKVIKPITEPRSNFMKFKQATIKINNEEVAKKTCAPLNTGKIKRRQRAVIQIAKEIHQKNLKKRWGKCVSEANKILSKNPALINKYNAPKANYLVDRDIQVSSISSTNRSYTCKICNKNPVKREEDICEDCEGLFLRQPKAREAED